MPNIYMLPAPGIPPLGPGWQPARGPLGRLRDATLRGLSARIWRRGVPPINRARGELGLPPLTTFWSQHDRADAVFVLTSRAFDFEAERLPDNVHYLGPVLVFGVVGLVMFMVWVIGTGVVMVRGRHADSTAVNDRPAAAA